MKRALIHEWFVDYKGSERCIESFTNIWNDFDIYALIDFLSDEERETILKGKKANTSFIQNLPFAKTQYRNYLPLFPFVIEQFDLRDYDLIISSSHAVAKGVLTHSNQLHISYIHTPIRYAWDLYHQYLNESGLNRGVKGTLAKYFLHKIRLWDISTINRVDYYIANSKYIARRIKKIYGKESKVIYPPVDIDKFQLYEKKDDYYFTMSRMVPYKKIDLIVEAFSKTDKKLVVAGTGPDFEKIKKLATPNIELLGYIDDSEAIKYMQRAKAFVFSAEEDFGITPVEAQACGTPVICLGKGGTKETILDGETGIHFQEQKIDSLLKAVEKFERSEFEPKRVRKNAERFSKQRFEKEIEEFVTLKYQQFLEER